MTRWAVGDVQGCDQELADLLARLRFSPDRDELWFVGDLVNRGPESLRVLRRVRALGDNVVCVLGNHDLHLLAVALAGARTRARDTLDPLLAARDRGALIQWLLGRPLAHHDPATGDLMVHAGILPQWSVSQVLVLARAVEERLQSDAPKLLRSMYGDEPRCWSDSLRGPDRLRFTINVLTRLRFCTALGCVDLDLKGPPSSAAAPWLPWFRLHPRASERTRILFGHWSALGWYRGDGVLGLDTGCVWGGALTAVRLDDPDAPPLSVPSRQPRWTGD